MFNGEMPAPEAAQPTLAQTDDPPPVPGKLVQAPGNYDLVFAEEFNGVAEGDGVCRNGFATLDGRKWNTRLDACAQVEWDGSACGNVKDGHYVTGKSKACHPGILNTVGKFSYRYGYLEVRYSFPLNRSRVETNSAFVLGGQKKPRLFKVCEYGMADEFVTVESLTRHLHAEIDIFEIKAGYAREFAHQYLNHGPYLVFRPDVRPHKSHKIVNYCDANDDHSYDPPPCQTGQTITVTKGLEWTPRGYRTLFRVEGVHDDFVVRPKDAIQVFDKPWEPAIPISPPGICDIFNRSQWWFGGSRQLTGADRDARFELLSPDDPDSLLEQVGVMHLPHDLSIVTWGVVLSSPARAPVSIDYIRVYRPTDHYASMEPVFQ